MARYLLSGLLIFTLQIGCAHHKGAARSVVSSALPAEDAPQFELAIEGNPVISTVSHRIEPNIQIVDVRGAIEKQYYPGESDPHRWRDAITVLPMEAFQPGFDQQLRRTVIDGLQDPLKYASIQIRVHSFFTTLDKRNESEERLLYSFRQWDDEQDEQELRRHEQELKNEAAEQEARRMRRSMGIPPVNGDDDPNFGSQVSRFLFKSAVVKPLRDRSRRKERTEQLKAMPQTLPSEFSSVSRSGWNCVMQLELQFIGEDNKAKTVTLKASQHVDHDQATSAEAKCQAVVLAALEQLRQQLLQQQI